MVLAYGDIEEIFQKCNLEGVWERPTGKSESITLTNERISLDTLTMNDETIEISSADQLMQISAAIASGDVDAANASYKLTANIKLGGKKWIPIGLSDTTPFTGVFDGAGYTISGFKIKSKGLEAAGFFGNIQGGTVANLTLDCVVDAKDGVLTGAMCANNAGEIINCHVRAKVYADRTCGGFVGKNAGEIERCSFIGKVVNL